MQTPDSCESLAVAASPACARGIVPRIARRLVVNQERLTPVTDPIRQFFSARTPIAEEQVHWLNGAIRLRLRVYLTEELPELQYVTSVRAVLATDRGYAVLSNADGLHVLPGGRREAGEELTTTLARELHAVALPAYQRLVSAAAELLS